MNKPNILFPILIGLATLSLLTQCNQTAQPNGPAGSDKVTSSPLTLTPAHLPATVTALPVSSTTGSPTPSLAITTLPPPSPTLADPTSASGPLPSLLAEIPLAPPGKNLVDILPHSDAARLYVTDTAG